MNVLLSRYSTVCRLIAELFPDQIEVVLHDVTTGSIVAIEGAYSNRKIGDKSLIELENLDQTDDKQELIGPYSQMNWDGEPLRSFTAVLTDEHDQTIGLLCVNCRTSAFSAAAQLLSVFSNINENTKPEALFKNDWRDSINQLISATLIESNTSLVGATRETKVEIVYALDQSGLLEFRGSPEYVAKSLGMSRASFYNLLKESRIK